VLGSLASRAFYGDRPARVRQLGGATMGTTWSLKLSLPEGAPEAWVRAIADTVQARLDRVERLMSTWDSTTQLSRFNRSSDTTAIRLSLETMEVLSISADIGRASGGALDVTVGPLVVAWGFGPGAGDRTPEPPGQALLDSLRGRVGLDRIRIDSEHSTAAKTVPDVEVDLSAVAKGYAVDQAASGVAALGVPDFALEVGGEVRASGRRPDGTGWTVAVEAPVPDMRSVYRVLQLRDEAVATSGDYRDFYEIGGVRYAHIIDPRTGRPVRWKGFSVTVVHREAARADAWATALAVLGPDEGFSLAEREGLAVLFVLQTDGRLEARATAPMEARLTGPGGG
jgi:thiamine biosynthesis lipoprotein